MRATALPVALVVVWDMHLFSLLGRRQPDTGVPRQSDVSAGVLLPPLQCWQAYCKGIPAIHFSVSSHDTCMHYHGCHGYTLGEGGWLFYKSVSVCHVSMCYPTEQGYNYCCLGNISAHLCNGLFSCLSALPLSSCTYRRSENFHVKSNSCKNFLCCYIRGSFDP